MAAAVLFQQHARLVKAEHELRELGARNLVIVDIYDDARAVRVGAARVFYAEGNPSCFTPTTSPPGRTTFGAVTKVGVGAILER